MNNPTTTIKYRADIDGLRAVAIIGVLVFHYFPTLLQGGFVGVDIFFVISGYLITSILLTDLNNNSFSIVNFYKRRIKRIFPALIITIIGLYCAAWFMLMPDQLKHLGLHISAGSIFMSNILSWSESGYFDKSADNKPLLHLWSLGIEEQYYIIWPIVLYILFKRSENRILSILITAGIASFFYNVYNVYIDSAISFFSPASRFWELLTGSLLAYAVFRRQPLAHNPKHSNLISMAGAAILILSLFFTKENTFPGWWAIPPVFGTALLIYAGQDAWVNKTILSNQVAVAVGLISFPLYLWHWPLISLLHITNNEPLSIESRIAALLVAAILSAGTYYLVEKPIRFGKSKGNKRYIILIISMACIGSWGYITYKNDGFGFRFPNYINKLVNKKSIEFYEKIIPGPYPTSKCFLEPNETDSAFGSCVEKKRPLIYLWGDSHAGALLPGLWWLQKQSSFGIASFSASSCPPLLNFNYDLRPHCKDINDSNFSRVLALRPEALVLHAYWVKNDLPLLENTIEILKAAGVSNLIIVGPVPAWKAELPKIVMDYYRRNLLNPDIPERFKDGLIDERFSLDQEMQDIAQRHNVNYVSAINQLCNNDGCLNRLTILDPELTTYDSAHVSISAAVIISKALGTHLNVVTKD